MTEQQEKKCLKGHESHCKQENKLVNCVWQWWKAVRKTTYLPCCKAGCAHQMPTRFNLHIFVILCTNFAKLERRTHFTIQFILFLKQENSICHSARCLVNLKYIQIMKLIFDVYVIKTEILHLYEKDLYGVLHKIYMPYKLIFYIRNSMYRTSAF